MTTWEWRELAPGVGLWKRTFRQGFARVAARDKGLFGRKLDWSWALFTEGEEPIAWGLGRTEGAAKKRATDAARERGWL